ncbi:MAG: SWIM zinc finger family protein [Patescibacteria group bacterium]|nr:SWIM zinc finger domain-containing protein [Patescibacteria group bacterium]
MKSEYSLDKIKFSVDRGTFQRAVKIFEDKKITKFKELAGAYSANVIGTSPYEVVVSKQGFDMGSCNCYLGQNDTLCKHMIALAIYSLFRGKPLTEAEKEQITESKSSGKVGSLLTHKASAVKQEITKLLKYIKPYNGPSRIWFQYQDSLSEGCNRLSALVSKLPICMQSADILVNLLLRLDRKLSTGGVDDSDGTVGDFIVGVVGVLQQYAKNVPECKESFKKLRNRETCFGWEESLIKQI